MTWATTFTKSITVSIACDWLFVDMTCRAREHLTEIENPLIYQRNPPTHITVSLRS